MFARLLCQMLILTLFFCQCIMAIDPDQCPPMDLVTPVPDFSLWIKQKLVEETDQNDQSDDKKLISDFVDDLKAKDKLMECEMKMQELSDNNQSGSHSLSSHSSHDDKNCENDRKMGIQFYKNTKQFQREIMGGKNDPKCVMAKFEAIKAQLTTLMDTVAATLDITVKKEYGIEEEKPAKYGNLAIMEKMAMVWITVGKGVAMDQKGMAKVLELMGSVMLMVESNLVLANPKGSTHRRRKRMDAMVIGVAAGGTALFLAFCAWVDWMWFESIGLRTLTCRA